MLILQISFAQAMKPLISLVLGGHFSYGLLMQLWPMSGRSAVYMHSSQNNGNLRSFNQALFRYRSVPTYQPKRKAARVHLPDSRWDSSLEHEVERIDK
jgi:hypothetical protein